MLDIILWHILPPTAIICRMVLRKSMPMHDYVRMSIHPIISYQGLKIYFDKSMNVLLIIQCHATTRCKSCTRSAVYANSTRYFTRYIAHCIVLKTVK